MTREIKIWYGIKNENLAIQHCTLYSICTCKVRINTRPDPDCCTQICSVIQYTNTGGGENKLFYKLNLYNKS